MNRRIFKRFIPAAFSVMLIFSCLSFPAAAEENTVSGQTKNEVKAELDNTAKAMCDYIKNKLSDEQAAPDINDLKNYTLILKSGYSDKTVTDELLNFVKNMINDTDNPISATYTDYSGNLTLSNNYPYIIAFLNEVGENSSDFNGYNFNSALEDAYLDETVAVNPYIEQYVVSAVNFNKKAFSEPEKIIKKAQKAVLDSYTSDDTNGTGIDYYGVSVDNNGQCLPVLKALYGTDNDVKEKVDKALAWTATQFSDKGEIVSWGSPNPSSTALAVKAFSEFNDFDNAAKALKGMDSFKSKDIEGVYEALNYSTNLVEADYSFATPDALISLLTYYRALNGIDALAVVSDDDTKPQPVTKEETTAAEDATAASETTAATGETTAAAGGEVPPTGDYAPIAAVAAILILSGLVYFGFSKKHA